MKKPRLIPEELIQIKANQIWKNRLRKGIEGTPESDWIKAKKYLEKHWWEVWLWRLKKVWKLITRKVRTLGHWT